LLTNANIKTEMQRISNEIDLINRLRLRPISIVALSKLVSILQNDDVDDKTKIGL